MRRLCFSRDPDNVRKDLRVECGNALWCRGNILCFVGARREYLVSVPVTLPCTGGPCKALLQWYSRRESNTPQGNQLKTCLNLT